MTYEEYEIQCKKQQEKNDEYIDIFEKMEEWQEDCVQFDNYG